MKLEVVPVPVSDVDREDFYAQKIGFFWILINKTDP
jgi:hypothetical protein